MAKGTIETVYAKGDVYVFARQYENDVALVALNRGNSEQTVELDVAALIPNGVKLVDELHDSYDVNVANGKVKLRVPAMDGRMLFGKVTVDLPNKVTNVQATEGIGQVELTWEGDAQTYRIYQSTLKGAGYQLVKETSEKLL